MTLKLNTKLNNKGLTVIELVVALLVMGILIVPITTLFRPTITGFFAGSPQLRLQEVLNGAINEICDNLRESKGITATTASSITFLNKNNASVTFELDGVNQVIKRVEGVTTYVPYYNTPTAPDKVKLSLAFTYFIKDNVQWVIGVDTDTSLITTVNISITGTYRTDQDYSLTVRNTVKLRVK